MFLPRNLPRKDYGSSRSKEERSAGAGIADERDICGEPDGRRSFVSVGYKCTSRIRGAFTPCVIHADECDVVEESLCVYGVSEAAETGRRKKEWEAEFG